MQRHGRGTLIALGAIVIAACGSTTSESPAADEPSTAAETTDSGTATPTTAASAETAPPADSADEPADRSDGDATTATDAAAEQPDDEGAAGSETADEVPATTAAPAVETTVPPAPAWPDDGCSPDNSATDVAEGPAPAVEVRAESADSPLPDLAVRRINCAGGWVNLKSEVPADRAVLVWFWAPH